MKTGESVWGCACCGMSRRRFLAAGCSACAGAAGLLAAPARGFAAGGTAKARIRTIYSLHAPKQPGPDWPNVGFDFVPVMDRINRELAQRCLALEFTSSMATGPEQARKILDDDKTAGIDGYLVYQMNAWNRVVQTIATSGKPVLYADFQYGGSGGFLVYTADFIRRQSPNVAFVASSRIEDLAEAAKCFSLVKKGGSTSDFVTAVAKLRRAQTPRPGDLACAPDSLTTVSAASTAATSTPTRASASTSSTTRAWSAPASATRARRPRCS